MTAHAARRFEAASRCAVSVNYDRRLYACLVYLLRVRQPVPAPGSA